MRRRDRNLPEMEALEPRLFLSVTVEESAFGEDYGDWFTTASLIELDQAGDTAAIGEIGSYRDYDFLKFVAPQTGGMQITMAAEADSAVDPLLYAFNSYSRAVAVNNNASRDTKDARISFAVEAGKTYYIAALGYYWSQGEYSLSFHTSADDYGNWFADAGEVEVSVSQTTTITSAVDYVNDRDFIKFTAPVSGGLRVEMTGTGQVDPFIVGYDQYYRTLAWNLDISRDSTDAALTMQVQAGQTYYIWAGGWRYTTGDYSLSLSITEDDYGNRFAEAGEVEVTVGQTTTLSSAIDYTNDRDFIKFTAPVSGGLRVEMTGAGQVDPFVVGYDQYYRALGWNLDISRDSTDAAFTMQVQAGQTYYIWAGGWGYTTGDYSLSLSVTEDEFGKTFAEAGTVELDENGAATVNTAYDYRWDIDVMKISATHSQAMTINVASMTDDVVMPWMLVYNQARQLIAYGTSRTGESVSMTFDAQAGQSYYLMTYNYNPYTTGAYQVDITTDLPTPPPPPEPDPDPPPPPPDPDPDPDIAPGPAVTAEIITDGDSRTLQVLGTDGIDFITLSQGINFITLEAAGETSTYAGSFTDVVIYGFAGGDTIRTTYSLAVRTTIYAGDGDDTIYENSAARTIVHGQGGDDLIVSIGGGIDTLYGGSGLDSFWYDGGDSVSDASSTENNAHSLHRIVSFYQPWTSEADSADYVSISINGQSLRDPTTTSHASGYHNFSSLNVFVDGAQYDDIVQGSVGDCYYLAALSSLADTDPQIIEQMITPLGDGTYAMRYYRNGGEVYLRLDGDLPVNSSGSLVYAKTGPDNELWVPLAEKAYAYFRYGQNSYASISGGWMTTVNQEITGVSSVWRSTTGSTATLATYIRNSLSQGHALTLGSYTSASSPVVGNHAYVIKSIDDTGYVTVYNPWGVDGRSWDNNYGDGLLRLTIEQIQSNFVATVISMA